jgi:hypothetical protein
MSARKRCYRHGNFSSVTALHLAVGYCHLHIGTGVLPTDAAQHHGQQVRVLS